MDAQELRDRQTSIKSQYRDEPGSALLTLRAEGSVGGPGVTCRVKTGGGLVTAGLHPATGGDGLAACSGEMLLEALVACAGVTLSAVASALGIALRGGTVSAEGLLDFRGTLSVCKDAPVGLQTIRLRFDVDTDADGDQLDTLVRLTERYCVVLQTLKVPAVMEVSRVKGENG